MESISIEILNWRKWQPRSDIKKPSWFAMSNDLIDDPRFTGWSALDFHALIYIFSLASKQNSAELCLIFEHARARNLNKKDLIAVLEKLEQIQCVRISRTDAFATGTTGITGTTENITKARPTASQFVEMASRYPKPKGPKAEERFREQIKTPEDLQDLENAIANYLAMLALKENSWRRPKQNFATFLGSKASGYFWRDFIDPSTAIGENTQKPFLVAE